MRRRRRLQHPGRESRHRQLDESLLMRVLSRYDKKGGLKLVRLWRAWESVVGPEIADMARPLGHKDGVLLLYTQDAIAAQQLSYYVPELLERVNSFFGQEVFDKVRLELLNGRVPLGQQVLADPSPTMSSPKKPSNLGGLTKEFDPESSVGRCYLAYVRRFLGQPAENAANDANTRPQGASRRRK